MKQAAIAAVIERDLLRDDARPSIDITKCFSCGHSMTYRGLRFCSDRCREWFDAGGPSYEQQQEWVRKPPVLSIVCGGCQKEFESKGLRCCSIDCERAYVERQQNLAIMAEVGIEPKAKRTCERTGCNARIPQWRNGRRVSSKTRFCSRRCQEKSRDSQNITLRAETMKKSA
jgi:predicted nucleic acid-binding Zn ribbon protein